MAEAGGEREASPSGGTVSAEKARKCPHGHSYRLSDRIHGARGCPFCRRARVARKEPARRRRRYKRNRIAVLARNAVCAAVKCGTLKRKPCSVCGKKKAIEGHHEDYSRPLDVIWLCQKHHHELHERQAH
jgi:hypothetical protein